MKHRLLIVFLLCAACLQAQPPAGYYNNAVQKKGYALRQALFSIVRPHTELSYTALWGAFQSTDVRPDNNKVWDIYSDNPMGQTSYYYVFGTNQCGNYDSEGDCYNREHSVPQSWFGEKTPMKTDLFHIYPTDGFVNGKRNNFAFGEVGNATWTSSNGSKLGSCSTSGYNGTVFEPIDEYKGDLARSYFYMAVCYMDTNLGKDNYSMFSGGSLKPWALNMLIRWHNEDPVSQKEIDRNNAIFNLQHNRNPFIDFPELVGKIWGSDSVNAFYPYGINEISMADRWRIHPIPANDHITIFAPESINEEVVLQILNLTGQILMSKKVYLDNQITFPLPDFTPGIYILRVKGKDFMLNKKILKQ